MTSCFMGPMTWGDVHSSCCDKLENTNRNAIIYSCMPTAMLMVYRTQVPIVKDEIGDHNESD